MIPMSDILKNALEIPSFDYMQLIYMIIRGIIVYFIGIFIARHNKKLIGIRTPFNFILFITLGSVFANAIIDSKVFLSIIGSMLFIIFFNAFIKKLAFHFNWIEHFVKGPSVELIKNGKINWDSMRTYSITERELLNELASQTHTYDISKVEMAILASDGSLNFILKQS